MDGETPTTPAPTPLGQGWKIAIVVIGVMAACLAIGGMILSFRAVSSEMTPSFGRQWAWLVPIVTDLTVLVFSGVDLVLNRLRMGHVLARVAVYGATAGTVWLNYAAGGSTAGRVAHILMPSIWVVFIELMRHVVRRLTGLADGTLREPVPVARWFLAPWRTVNLWRRMILWSTNSYPKALVQERRRLEAIALLRDEHGRFWRWRISPLVRLQLSLGEAVHAPSGDAHAVGSRTETSARNEESATHDGPEAATQRTDAKSATRTGRTKRTTAPKVTRLTSHAERTRIIEGLFAQRGAKGVTPKVVADELGIDRSNGYRALQRFLKENPTRPAQAPEAAPEDEPERAWAAS